MKQLPKLVVAFALGIGALWLVARAAFYKGPGRDSEANPGAKNGAELSVSALSSSVSAGNSAPTSSREEAWGPRDLPEVISSGTSAASDAARATVFQNLRSAIEASTYERMDPHAMLEAAKSVLSLELADRVIPEISDSGEIVVPFLNAPKGIAAELTISRSKYYGNVLGLRIVMESAEGPYYFDGTYRNEAECTIRAYGDPVNGGLATLGFMTNLEPAPGPGSSWAYLAKASFNQGLLYNINADGAPMSAMMNACGYKDGQSATWDVPITLDSSVSSADASEFATRMKSIYQNLRDQRRDK